MRSLKREVFHWPQTKSITASYTGFLRKMVWRLPVMNLGLLWLHIHLLLKVLFQFILLQLHFICYYVSHHHLIYESKELVNFSFSHRNVICLCCPSLIERAMQNSLVLKHVFYVFMQLFRYIPPQKMEKKRRKKHEVCPRMEEMVVTFHPLLSDVKYDAVPGRPNDNQVRFISCYISPSTWEPDPTGFPTIPLLILLLAFCALFLDVENITIDCQLCLFNCVSVWLSKISVLDEIVSEQSLNLTVKLKRTTSFPAIIMLHDIFSSAITCMTMVHSFLIDILLHSDPFWNCSILSSYQWVLVLLLPTIEILIQVSFFRC